MLNFEFPVSIEMCFIYMQYTRFRVRKWHEILLKQKRRHEIVTKDGRC